MYYKEDKSPYYLDFNHIVNLSLFFIFKILNFNLINFLKIKKKKIIINDNFLNYISDFDIFLKNRLS